MAVVFALSAVPLSRVNQDVSVLLLYWMVMLAVFLLPREDTLYLYCTEIYVPCSSAAPEASTRRAAAALQRPHVASGAHSLWARPTGEEAAEAQLLPDHRVLT